MATVRDAQVALAFRLARHLLPDEGGGSSQAGNVAFSPLSVHTALALVTEGAQGGTLSQLLEFLGVSWRTRTDLANFASRVSDDVVADWSASGGPKVLLGGGVWVDASRGALNKRFRDTVTNAYRVDAGTVDFQKKPEEAAKAINDYIMRATDNRVKSVISAADVVRGETDIVLANAIYFSGQWPARTFHPWGTETGPFYRLDGWCSYVYFMCTGEYQYAKAMDGFKVLRLRYQNGGGKAEFSMCIFLPDARYGISAMVDSITAIPGVLRDTLPKERVRAVVKLPKFKVSYDCQLDRFLPEMGLHLPFSWDAADLRGMLETDGDPSRPAFLSGMVSKVVVEVNEEGTEASAFTRILRPEPFKFTRSKRVHEEGTDPQPEPFMFVADHPFTFFIVEEWSGVVVFAGHVLEPSV